LKTGFSEAPAVFNSPSQAARVETESWAAENMFCPNCQNPRLSAFSANRPVADLFGKVCGDEFELKSQQKSFGKTVADGAYETKIERLKANNAPHLLLLHYDKVERKVHNLRIVPRFFFTAEVIQRRKPLGPHARRAGWVGSNILLNRIPMSGQIPIVQDGLVIYSPIFGQIIA